MDDLTLAVANNEKKLNIGKISDDGEDWDENARALCVEHHPASLIDLVAQTWRHAGSGALTDHVYIFPAQFGDADMAII